MSQEILSLSMIMPSYKIFPLGSLHNKYLTNNSNKSTS